MKILQKILRPAEEPLRDTARTDHSFDPAAETGRSVATDDYHHEMSFNWQKSRPLSSSIFDTPARGTLSPEHAPTSPLRILSANASVGDDLDENEGYDPYNTGSFDAKQK